MDEGTLIVLSMHGPMSWEDEREWYGFLSEVAEQIGQLGALGGTGRVQFLAGGDWNVDLDGDSDRLTSLEETLRGWRPIRAPPTFVRPSGEQVRLGSFYASGA